MFFAALLMQVASVPAPMPTPRDLHTSCHLLLRGNDANQVDGQHEPFSSWSCALATLSAITHREGRAEGKPNDLRFCLPNTADVSADIGRAMAAAYIDWFEQRPQRANQMEGRTAFVLAMIERWPCQPR